MMLLHLALGLVALLTYCTAVAVPPTPEEGPFIPLEFNKNYTLEDISKLREHHTNHTKHPQRDLLPTEPLISKDLVARTTPAPLEKRDSISEVGTAYYHFRCPRGGVFYRNLEWKVEVTTPSFMIDGIGLSNVDSFTGPAVELTHTPFTYYNSIIHDFCGSTGHYVCNYRIRGSFWADFEHVTAVPFNFNMRMHFQTSTAPGTYSQPHVTESCTYLAGLPGHVCAVPHSPVACTIIGVTATIGPDVVN